MQPNSNHLSRRGAELPSIPHAVINGRNHVVTITGLPLDDGDTVSLGGKDTAKNNKIIIPSLKP